jgi:8-oxo-dGTP diphosphatase
MAETQSQRAQSKVAVYAIMERDGKYLLLKRQNTGYQDGNYGLPSGHVEQGELITKALEREVAEEIGAVVVRSEFVHLSQRASKSYVDVFFRVSEWDGEIANMEPDKCAELAWHDRYNLPQNMIPFVGQVLKRIGEGTMYSEYIAEP